MCLHDDFREMGTPASSDRWRDGLACLEGFDVSTVFYDANKYSKDTVGGRMNVSLTPYPVLRPIMKHNRKNSCDGISLRPHMQRP